MSLFSICRDRAKVMRVIPQRTEWGTIGNYNETVNESLKLKFCAPSAQHMELTNKEGQFVGWSVICMEGALQTDDIIEKITDRDAYGGDGLKPLTLKVMTIQPISKQFIRALCVEYRLDQK